MNPKAAELIRLIKVAGEKPIGFFAEIRNLAAATEQEDKEQILTDRTSLHEVIMAIAEITNQSRPVTRISLYVEMRQHLEAKEAMSRFVDTEGVSNEELLPITLAERLLSPTD